MSEGGATLRPSSKEVAIAKALPDPTRQPSDLQLLTADQDADLPSSLQVPLRGSGSIRGGGAAGPPDGWPDHPRADRAVGGGRMVEGSPVPASQDDAGIR